MSIKISEKKLTPCELWTKDRPLLAAANELGVAYAALGGRAGEAV